MAGFPITHSRSYLFDFNDTNSQEFELDVDMGKFVDLVFIIANYNWDSVSDALYSSC